VPHQAAAARGSDEDADRYRLIDRARTSSSSDLQAQAFEAAAALCEMYALACFERALMFSKGRGVARNEQAALALMEKVQRVRAALPERFGRCPVPDKIACLPWTLNPKVIADLKVHAAPKALLAQCKTQRVESCLEILRSLGDVSQDIKLQAAAEVQDACRRGHESSCEFMAPPTNEEPNLEADMAFVMKGMKEMCERGDESACLITKGSQD
jgi:TPR repeat protein